MTGKKKAPPDLPVQRGQSISTHLNAEAKAGRITAVGMTKPTRASRRHSRNLVWVGAA